MGRGRTMRAGAAGWLAAAVALWLSLTAAPAAAAMSAARLVDPLGDAPVCSTHSGRHAPSPAGQDACEHCLACCGAPAAAPAPAPPALPLPLDVAYAPRPVAAWRAPRGPPAARPRARDPPPTALS